MQEKTDQLQPSIGQEVLGGYCGGYSTRVPHEQAWQPTKRGAAQPTVLDLKTCGTSRRTEEGSGRRSPSWNRNYCKEGKDS